LLKYAEFSKGSAELCWIMLNSVKLLDYAESQGTVQESLTAGILECILVARLRKCILATGLLECILATRASWQLVFWIT
jgi:hypothetical protein